MRQSTKLSHMVKTLERYYPSDLIAKVLADAEGKAIQHGHHQITVQDWDDVLDDQPLEGGYRIISSPYMAALVAVMEPEEACPHGIPLSEPCGTCIEKLERQKLLPARTKKKAPKTLGIIQRIQEVENIEAAESYRHMDGYEVVTDQQTWRVLISNWQSCCESWGYLTSEDDLQRFIGARLREVRLTDTALNQQVVDDTARYLDEGGIQFVDFVTNRGVFQLAVYCGHNGYYGHGILITQGETALLESSL